MNRTQKTIIEAPWWIVAALLFALAGCAAGQGAPTAQTSSGIDIVVIGDSQIDTENHCPGCTGFTEQFRQHVEEQLGAPTTAERVLTLTVADAVERLDGDSHVDDLVSSAEIVVVQVGFNNALPDPATGIGCPGDLPADASATDFYAWMQTTDSACLSEGVATYGDLYDHILARVRELRGDEPLVLIVTNTIDGNIDPSRVDSLVGWMPPDDRATTMTWTLAAYERWNTMLAERAAAADADLVDLFHIFNGPDGTSPTGDLTVDSAHPSQAGNDAIAHALESVDLRSVTP